MKSSLFTWLLYICGLLENVKHSHFSGFFCFYIFFKSYASHIQGRKVFWHIVLFWATLRFFTFCQENGKSVQCFIEIGNHHASLSLLEFFYFLKTWLSATVHLLYIVFSSATSCPVLSFLRWPFWDIPSFCLISPWITFLVQKIRFNPCQTVIVGFLKKIPIHIFFNLWYVLSFYFIINTPVGMTIILFLAFSSRPVFIGALQIAVSFFLLGFLKTRTRCSAMILVCKTWSTVLPCAC